MTKGLLLARPGKKEYVTARSSSCFDPWEVSPVGEVRRPGGHCTGLSAAGRKSADNVAKLLRATNCALEGIPRAVCKTKDILVFGTVPLQSHSI